jgi:hypothetical protein
MLQSFLKDETQLGGRKASVWAAPCSPKGIQSRVRHTAGPQVLWSKEKVCLIRRTLWRHRPVVGKLLKWSEPSPVEPKAWLWSRQAKGADVPPLTSCGVSHTCRSCVAWALISDGKSDHECEHHPCTCSLAIATEQRELFFTCSHTLGGKGSPHCTHHAQRAWCLVQT